MAGTYLRITDHGDLRAAARALRRHGNGKALLRELRTGIRRAIVPLGRQLKAAYGAGNIRSKLARAAAVEVRTAGRSAGARIRVDGRKMPPGMGRIPAYWEGLGRWRHPVFGHPPWVTQSPHPTFDRVVLPGRHRVRSEIDRFSSEIMQRIAKG